MPGNNYDNLSESEKVVFETLVSYQEKSEFPPTIREIIDRTDNTSTSTVSRYLDGLEEKGYIRREKNVSRGIRILTPKSVPIVSSIAAGLPLHIPESGFSPYDSESTVELPEWMIPQNSSLREVFAVKVKGDSMIDALVDDGDIVILKQAEIAQNGDMVAAWLVADESTTLKYFYREGPGVRLQPANPNYPPVYFHDPGSLLVQGKVVGVIRHLA